MRRPAPANKPRTSQIRSFPSPTGGWVANRNLARPDEQGVPQGAAVLDNWFPTSTSAILRRGSKLHATLGDGTKPTTALFSYVAGAAEHLFGATDTTIYDISSVPSSSDAGDTFGDSSTVGLEVLTGQTGGNWSVVQFATTGGIFLLGVNGVDSGFKYDGTSFAALGPTITDAATSSFSYVWAYKNRIWFVERDSLNAWYINGVDQIGGTVKKFPLGGIFGRGGSLLFGATWSLDSGQSGGLSEQCIFVSTEGEVAVFQGSNPADAADWRKVGVYRIGKPLGINAWIRAGGDLVIATSIGFVPLSQAIQRDYAALSPSAVSYPIEEAWNAAVLQRGASGWTAEVWPESQMVVIAPPVSVNTSPEVYVANARTGAWARFAPWAPTCLEVFRGRLFFGSTNGRVVEANVGGTDEGSTYTGAYVPLFDDFRTSGSLKIGDIARVTIRSRAPVNERLAFQADFRPMLPPAPDAPVIAVGNEWGNAIWGESVWNAPRSSLVTAKWKSVGGSGYAISLSVQVTSGAIVPLDAELIRVDMTYQTADIVT